MFQVTYLGTNKPLPDLFYTESEAQRGAVIHYGGILSQTPMGRRTLNSLKHIVRWKHVQGNYLISEMVGVFISTVRGDICPQETTEDNSLVFVDRSGGKHIGDYDESEGLYLDNLGNTYTPDRVVEFLVLPDCSTDR